MAVTVDIASGGRLELGIGAGWFEAECEAYGIELGSITERFDRLEEALTVIHSLLTQPTTNFDGRYYRLRDAWCEPKAMQQPHPPIVLGGKGERRLLPLVARFADHWNYSGDDPAEFARLRDAPRRAVRRPRAGSIGDLTLSANVRPPTDDPGRVADDVAAYGEAGADMICVLLPRPYDPRLLEAARRRCSTRCADTGSAGDEVGHLAHERLLQHRADQRHVRRRVGAGERLAGTTGWRRRP